MVDDCWLERSRNVNCLLFVWMATIRRERSSTICLTRSRCVCSTVFFFLLLLLFPVSFRLPLSDAVEYATRIHLFLYIVYIGSSAGSVGRTRLTLSRSWRPAAAASFLSWPSVIVGLAAPFLSLFYRILFFSSTFCLSVMSIDLYNTSPSLIALAQSTGGWFERLHRNDSIIANLFRSFYPFRSNDHRSIAYPALPVHLLQEKANQKESCSIMRMMRF